MPTPSAPRSRSQWKIIGLSTCLALLVLAATAFTISIVQIQAAVAAYVGGESIWSRGQLLAVRHLEKYALNGERSALTEARSWLAIPLGDMAARRAMERSVPDIQQARAGLLRGQNHPDDVSRMIWLYINFSQLSVFQEATAAWQGADEGLLELAAIASQLETLWSQDVPDQARLQTLYHQIADVNLRLGSEAQRFRLAMGDASRSVQAMLTLASIVFLALVSVLAWRISVRLVNILRTSEHKFRAIFEQSSIGILQIAEDGTLLDANQAGLDTLAYQRDNLKQIRFGSLIHPEDRAQSLHAKERILRGSERSRTLEQRMIKGDGETIWARLTATLVSDRSGGQPYFIAMLEDISEAHRMSDELSHQASHDPLTDLLNRRAFEHRLAGILGRARSGEGHHALCFLDLDRFKVVNDTSGHAAGDQLLILVAETLRNNLRDGDVLARLGGDEFGIILENCELRTALTIAEKLRQVVEELAFAWERRQHRIGASIGVAPITEHAPDISALMRSADLACYNAKHRGRNQVCLPDEKSGAGESGNSEHRSNAGN